MLTVLWLLGCEAAEEAECREGFTREADGHCYPPLSEPADIEGVLAALPACNVVAPGDGAIDLTTGCASDVCPGSTYAEMSVQLHEWPACSTSSWSSTAVLCAWSAGVEGLFADEDKDTVPDEGAGNDRVRLYPPYEGTTGDGLGVGATPRCFVDALGLPEWLGVRDVGGTLHIEQIFYDRYGLRVYDWGSDDGTGAPNGYLDNVYLYGTAE